MRPFHCTMKFWRKTLITLHDRSVEAISFTGSQSGILTDGAHRSARITAVRGDRIREELARGRVVIVAGFQGVNPETREITTLGHRCRPRARPIDSFGGLPLGQHTRALAAAASGGGGGR